MRTGRTCGNAALSTEAAAREHRSLRRAAPMQRLLAALLVVVLLLAGTVYANRVGAQMPRASSNTSVPCMLCESLVVRLFVFLCPPLCVGPPIDRVPCRDAKLRQQIALELALTSAPNVTQAQVLAILRNVCNSSFFSKYSDLCHSPPS